VNLDRRKYLRPEEREVLLDHLEREAIVGRAKGHRVPVRDYHLFVVAFASGLRPTELALLHVGDLHLGRSEVRLTAQRLKRRKHVVEDVKLPRALGKPMRSYLEWLEAAGLSTEADAPLFPGRSGKPITRSGIFRRWKVALAGAGLPSYYELRATRHTAGTIMYSASHDLRAVQQHLGHVKVTTTEQYVGVLDEDYQDAVDAAWKHK